MSILGSNFLQNIKRNLTLDTRDVLIALTTSTLFILFVPIFTYIYFAKDLVSKEKVMNRNDTGVTLLDRNSKPFFVFYSAKYKSFIPLSEIPKTTQQAVVTEEDKEFYSHPGFSIKAILGATMADLRRKDLGYGGSTITQQLVKNALLNSNKNFLRKYQEIILSQELERKFSKNEILEMYLNSAYFGQGAFGVDEAAQVYFNKRAKELDLAQSALLAGLLPAPSTLSPISGDSNRAKLRQKFVLKKMLSQKLISEKEEKQAEDEKLTFNSTVELNSKAPHFALEVRDQLIQRYGEEQVARSGFKVRTSIDLIWQEIAEGALKEQVANLRSHQVSNGAVIVLDPKTGEVKTLVGSIDWYNNEFGKVNMAISPRQPGSSFKPIVYSAALEEHLITPATLLKDEPTTFPGGIGQPPYKPVDFDHQFRGPVLVRRVLANSLNVPSVAVMQKVGIPAALEMAQRLGVTTLKNPSNYGLSLVLGTGEVKLLDLVSVYSVFANGGVRNEPTTILTIEDKYGQNIYSHSPEQKQVLEKEVAFLISSILSDNGARAEEFGSALTTSRLAAVKTGTTENFRDAWTIGYTPSLVVGVWIGNNSGSLMDGIAGSLGPAPIWRNLMEKFLANTPTEIFTKPDGIADLYICRSNGLKLKEASSSGYLEYFIKGTEPTSFCELSKTLASPSPEASPLSSTPTPPPTAAPNHPGENPGKDKGHKD